MTATVTLPQMLNIPPKLLPMLTEFNRMRYFLLQGGRGGGKTQSVARFLLYLAGLSRIRVVCGREVQNSIEESVYTVLRDLIDEFNLPFDVKATKLTHKVTGSTFGFKGFREQGRINIKGMEGVDVLWIDEAQSVVDATLEILIPTIRKDKAKLFFTMNRFMRDDAVPGFLEGREDALDIQINYDENPFCTAATKVEAMNLRAKSEREYKHVYLNVPLDTADDYLFNYEKLQAAKRVVPTGATSYPARILAFDFAAQGNDQCVATILDRVTNQHWKVEEQIAWDESDAMISIGKIVNLVGAHRPTISILDVGGMGHVVHNRLTEIGVDIKRFDGASVDMVDKQHYVNARANGYYDLKDWFDQGFLMLGEKDNDCIKELEKIKMKFRSDGRRLLQSKVDMKKDLGYSPDKADSLMMAVWAATRYLGNSATHDARAAPAQAIQRVTKHTRRDTAPRRAARR